MSSLRKCKACSCLVKGHPGPYGLAKCKNVPLENEESVEESASTKAVELEVAHEYENNEDNVDKTDLKENIVTNLMKQKHVVEPAHAESTTEVVDDNVSSATDYLDLEVDPTNSFNDGMESSEDGNDESHFLELSVDNDKKPIDKNSSIKTDTQNSLHHKVNDDTELNEDNEIPKCMPVNDDNEAEESPEMYEIPDCSLEEASLCFGATASNEERTRLFSQSDTNVDIRNLIIGRAFVLCFCDNVDCECEGEVNFAESLKAVVGSIVNLYYMDPRPEFDTDLEPKLTFVKTGWKAKEPNTIKLKLGGVSTPGVLSSTGEVVLTANRVVELVKGRKELSTVITGRIGLSIKLGADYIKEGFKSPMKFKDMECSLYMIEDEVVEAVEGLETDEKDDGLEKVDESVSAK